MWPWSFETGTRESNWLLACPAQAQAFVVVSDALDRKSLDQAAETIIGRFGQLDGLINGAGGNHPQATARPDQSFFDLTPEGLRSVLDLNWMGTVLPCQSFGKLMAKRGEGVILNVSSMAALRPLTRVVGYSAAKAGVSNFTTWLAVHMAQEYSPRIRVNAIAPGFFLTEQNRAMLTDVSTGQLTARGQSIVSHTPMKRFGEPEELLGAVLWLLSPGFGFCHRHCGSRGWWLLGLRGSVRQIRKQTTETQRRGESKV